MPSAPPAIVAHAATRWPTDAARDRAGYCANHGPVCRSSRLSGYHSRSMARSIPKPTCSFCGKTQNQRTRLIAGPRGAFICSACVALCSEIFSEPPGGDNASEAKGGARTGLQAIRPVARRLGGRRLWPWRARVAGLASFRFAFAASSPRCRRRSRTRTGGDRLTRPPRSAISMVDISAGEQLWPASNRARMPAS